MNLSDHVVTKHRLLGRHAEWVWAKSDQDNSFDAIADHWVCGLEEKWLRAVSFRRSVCIQAGGNCGMYPKLLAQRFHTVYTFEPDPVNFYALTQNCTDKNIIKVQAALGATCGTCGISRKFPNNSGSYRVVENQGPVLRVSIDSFNLPVVDFMQLDVEGYEEQVIAGAVDTIRRCEPVISVESPTDFLHHKLTEHLGYRGIQGVCDDVIYTR